MSEKQTLKYDIDGLLTVTDNGAGTFYNVISDEAVSILVSDKRAPDSASSQKFFRNAKVTVIIEYDPVREFSPAR